MIISLSEKQKKRGETLYFVSFFSNPLNFFQETLSPQLIKIVSPLLFFLLLLFFLNAC